MISVDHAFFKALLLPDCICIKQQKFCKKISVESVNLDSNLKMKFLDFSVLVCVAVFCQMAQGGLLKLLFQRK